MALSNTLIYTGIGPRERNSKVLTLMSKIATHLARKGYVLRSGGAIGSDLAFEGGCDLVSGKKEIYTPNDINWGREWYWHELYECLPEGVTTNQFHYWKEYTRKLLARNMMQVLGSTGDIKTNFIVTHVSTQDYYSRDVGGTGYALRCALRHDIPIYNLASKTEYNNFINTYVRESHPLC